MVYSKHAWCYIISEPQTWFNLSVNEPRSDRDRSLIWELDYGITSRKIILFMWNYVHFKEFVKQWHGPNLGDGFCYVEILPLSPFMTYNYFIAYVHLFGFMDFIESQ